MKKVAVSCILPVYNVEKYIAQMIEQLVKQTFQNIELIFVDDASTDNSLAIIESFQTKYEMIKVIRNETNLGAGRSRNRGLQAASGEFVVFLDADDIVSVDLVKKLYAKVTCCKADCVIYFAGRFLDGEKRVYMPDDVGKIICNVKSYPILDEPEKYSGIFELITNSPCDKMIRREILEKNAIEFSNYPRTNDMFYSFASVLSSCRIVYLDEILYFQRKNRVGSISSVHKARTYIVEVLEEIYLFEKKRMISKEIENRFWEFALHRIYITLYDMQDEERCIFRNKMDAFLEKYYKEFLNSGKVPYSEIREILFEKILQFDYKQKYDDILYTIHMRQIDVRKEKEFKIKNNILGLFLKIIKSKEKYNDYMIQGSNINMHMMFLISVSWMKNKFKNKFMMKEIT